MLTLLLIVHLVVVATGTGMVFASYIAIRLAAGEQGDRRASLVHFRRVMGQFGDVTISLIWMSGIALAWTYRVNGAPEMTSWFYVKLMFVVVLTLCHFLARRTAGAMARTGNDNLYGRMELLVSLAWLSAVFSIILAVVAFHG